MHELSIAMSIVEGAEEEAAKHPGERVWTVHLRLGQLSGVVRDALLFSYELACEGTALEGSFLEIQDVTPAFFCGVCQAEREIASIQDLLCGECSTPSAELIRGREILIVGLELGQEYAATTR
jgi:hydrogenase nickel incorporation protein HypA/HybF